MIAEKWNKDLKSKDILLNEDESICSTKCSSYRSVYGKILISSGCHEWKFKVHKTNIFAYALLIGITKEEWCSKRVDTFMTDSQTGYAWTASHNAHLLTSGNAGKVYGETVKNGDIFTMKLDFDNAEMSFIVNGKDYGIAPFEKAIDKECKYRMGVTFHDQGELEILDYQQIR